MPKKRAQPVKPELPPYVVLKNGVWVVRVGFPTSLRDQKGRIIYDQLTRQCEPETEERAKEIVEFLQGQYQQAKSRVSDVSRVADFLEQFLASKKKTVTRRTYEFYEDLYEDHVRDSSFSKKQLESLKPLDIQKFYDSSSASADTIRKVNIFLSMAFDQAVTWSLLDANPCKGAMLPAVRPKETGAFSKAEAKKVTEIWKTSTEYAVFEFALETSLRPQEFLAVRWQDIDFTNRKLRVRQALAEPLKGGGFEIKGPKNKQSDRTIGFSIYMRERLHAQRKFIDDQIKYLRAEIRKPLLLPHKKAKGTNYAARKLRRQLAREKLENYLKYDLVFPASSGKPWSKNNLNRRLFKGSLEKAGVDANKYSIESLRHTSLTFLADHLHPKKLQKHAGHASLHTTLKYYVHVDDDSTFAASEKMAAILY